MEKKGLIKLSDLRVVQIPKWPEVNVKTLYEHYLNDEEVAWYLPDKFTKGRQIDRSFFFNVLNTIVPSHVQMII